MYKRRRNKKGIKKGSKILKKGEYPIETPKLVTNKLFIETQKPKMLEASQQYKNPLTYPGINPFMGGFNPFFNPLLGLSNVSRQEPIKNDNKYEDLLNIVRVAVNKPGSNLIDFIKKDNSLYKELKLHKDEYEKMQDEFDINAEEFEKQVEEEIKQKELLGDGMLKEENKKNVLENWGIEEPIEEDYFKDIYIDEE